MADNQAHNASGPKDTPIKPPSAYFLESATPYDEGCKLQLQLERAITTLLKNDGGEFSEQYDGIIAGAARREIAQILGIVPER